MASGNEQKLRDALAIPAGQKLDPTAGRQLAALGPIRLDTGTFKALDATHATVTGTVTHPPAGISTRWTFQLIYLSGQWKITDSQATG